MPRQFGTAVFAKPAPDKRVRKEDGHPLAAEGEIVTYNSYWLRRKNDKDVELSDPPKPAAESKPASAKAAKPTLE